MLQLRNHLLIALGSVLLLHAQDTPRAPVAEPQYINSFYALDANGKLIELEHATAMTFHSKTKMLLPGYASLKMLAEFKPGHASVRLDRDVARFIVLGRSAVDPSSRYELRRLKSSRDHREFLITQAHASVLGAAATSGADDGAISVRFEEYGVNSYRITSEHPLVAGEYGLLVRGLITDLYCFGVDR